MNSFFCRRHQEAGGSCGGLFGHGGLMWVSRLGVIKSLAQGGALTCGTTDGKTDPCAGPT
jgi:hypothetical protein